jgi:hypothetical protein
MTRAGLCGCATACNCQGGVTALVAVVANPRCAAPADSSCCFWTGWSAASFISAAQLAELAQCVAGLLLLLLPTAAARLGAPRKHWGRDYLLFD